MAHVNLSQMKPGLHGTIVALDGGHGMVRKLESIGIRPGVKLIKLSEQFMRGPIVVKVGATQIALGRGMAQRVIVDVDAG